MRSRALLEVREVRELLSALPEELLRSEPRALALSGLPTPVLLTLALLVARRLKGEARPLLVVVRDAAAATRLTEEMVALGLAAAAYPSREFVLYHVTASHDEERRRLGVLSALLRARLMPSSPRPRRSSSTPCRATSSVSAR